MLEGLLTQALREGVVRAAKDLVNANEEHILGTASSVLVRLMVGPLGTAAVEVLSGCLKALSAQDDRLKLLSGQLSKLLREPLLTGVEQLRVAESLTPSSEIDISYRQDRYRAALVSLDRALSIAQPQETGYVNALRGLAALRIPGGNAEAKMHLECAIAWLEESALLLQKEAVDHDGRASECATRAMGFGAPQRVRVGGLVGWDALYAAGKQREWLILEQKHAATAKDARSKHRLTIDGIDTLRFLTEQSIDKASACGA